MTKFERKLEKLKKYVPLLESTIRKRAAESLTTTQQNHIQKLKDFRDLIVDKSVKDEAIDRLEIILAKLFGNTKQDEISSNELLERNPLSSHTSQNNDNITDIVNDTTKTTNVLIYKDTAPKLPSSNETGENGIILYERRQKRNPPIISDNCCVSEKTDEPRSQTTAITDSTRVLVAPEAISSSCSATEITDYASKKEENNEIPSAPSIICAKYKISEILTNSFQNKNNLRYVNTRSHEPKPGTSKQDIMTFGNKEQPRKMVHLALPKFKEFSIQQPEIDASKFQSYGVTNKVTEEKTNESKDQKDDVEYLGTVYCDKELKKCDSSKTESGPAFEEGLVGVNKILDNAEKILESDKIIDTKVIAGSSSLPKVNSSQESCNTPDVTKHVEIPLLSESVRSIEEPIENIEVDIAQDLLKESTSLLGPRSEKPIPALHQTKITKVANIEDILPSKKRISVEDYIEKNKLTPNSTMGFGMLAAPWTSSFHSIEHPTTHYGHSGILNMPNHNMPNMSVTTHNQSCAEPINPITSEYDYNSVGFSPALSTDSNERPVMPTTYDSPSNTLGQLTAIHHNTFGQLPAKPHNCYEGPVGSAPSYNLPNRYGHSFAAPKNSNQIPVRPTSNSLCNTFYQSQALPNNCYEESAGSAISDHQANRYGHSMNTPKTFGPLLAIPNNANERVIGPFPSNSFPNRFNHTVNNPIPNNLNSGSNIQIWDKYPPGWDSVGATSPNQSFASSQNRQDPRLPRNSQSNVNQKNDGFNRAQTDNRSNSYGNYTSGQIYSQGIDGRNNKNKYENSAWQNTRHGYNKGHWPRRNTYGNNSPKDHNNQNENLTSKNHYGREQAYQSASERSHQSPPKSASVRTTDHSENTKSRRDTSINKNTQHGDKKPNMQNNNNQSQTLQKEQNEVHRTQLNESQHQGIVYTDKNIGNETAMAPISSIENYKIPKIKPPVEKKGEQVQERSAITNNKTESVGENKSNKKGILPMRDEKKSSAETGKCKDETNKKQTEISSVINKRTDDTPLIQNPDNIEKVERPRSSNIKTNDMKHLTTEKTSESQVKCKSDSHVKDSKQTNQAMTTEPSNNNVLSPNNSNKPELDNSDDIVKTSDSKSQEFNQIVNEKISRNPTNDKETNKQKCNNLNMKTGNPILMETNKKPITCSKESQKKKPGPKSKTKRAQKQDDDDTYQSSAISGVTNYNKGNKHIGDTSCFTDKYYYFYKKISIYPCRLCVYSGEDIVDHYKQQHPHAEIPLSRMRPKTVKETLKQLKDTNIQAISEIPTDTYTCRFCSKKIAGNEKSALESFFWHIVKTHTGEYSKVCSECVNVTKCPLNLDIPPCPNDKGQLVGYMCSKCNFTQISIENLNTHIKIRHHNHKIKVLPIILGEISDRKLSIILKILKKQNKRINEYESPLKVINTSSIENATDPNAQQDKKSTDTDDTNEPPSKRSRKIIDSADMENTNKSSCQTNITSERSLRISPFSTFNTNIVNLKIKTESREKPPKECAEQLLKTESTQKPSDHATVETHAPDYSHFKISHSIAGTKEYWCCINGKEKHFRTKLLISMKKHVQTKHNELWNGYCFVCKVVVTPQGQQCDFNGCLQHLIDKHMDDFPVLPEPSVVEEEAEKSKEKPTPKLLSISRFECETTSSYEPVTSDQADSTLLLPKIVSTIRLAAQVPEHVTNGDQTYINQEETDSKYEVIQSEVMSSKDQVIMNKMSKEKLVHVFKCAGRYCSFTSDSAEEALVHASAHARVGGAGALRCAYCSFDCAGNASNLVTHVFDCHGPCTFACGYCFYRAAAEQLVAAHITEKHCGFSMKVLSSSTVAPSTTRNQNVLTQYVVVPHYICPHACQYRTYAAQEFCEHLRKRHANKNRHACYMCSESENSAEDLVAHMKSHGLNVYQCTWCVHGADSEPQLLAHAAAAHPARQPQAYLRLITTKHDGKGLTEPSLVSLNKSQVNVEKVTPNLSKEDPVREAQSAVCLENLHKDLMTAIATTDSEANSEDNHKRNPDEIQLMVQPAVSQPSGELSQPINETHEEEKNISDPKVTVLYQLLTNNTERQTHGSTEKHKCAFCDAKFNSIEKTKMHLKVDHNISDTIMNRWHERVTAQAATMKIASPKRRLSREAGVTEPPAKRTM